MIDTLKESVLLTLIGFLLANTLTGQSIQTDPCAFDPFSNNRSILNSELIIQQGVDMLKQNKLVTNDIRTIPIVVHVLHTGGTENISDAQINSQITILNEDFGKMTGTNGDGNGVDTKVRFCLAKIDPNGNCTNGIVRVYTPLTNHKTYERAMLKQLSFWDNTKYLNMYIVKSISGGTLGYSSFPGGPDEEDGMVMEHSSFGNMGTASSGLGRTPTHEVGHWFGLYHTFNNGCGADLCNDGDYVCDTPPQEAPSFNCSVINSCHDDVPDVDDQKENYMNYTPDVCKNMFTEGQKLRMHSTLDNIRTNIWTQSNLEATGCDSLYSTPIVCPTSANFVTLTPDVCVGNSVNFMDISLNNATSWSWTFEGGNPSSSTDQNPTINYSITGDYDVKLVVSDGITSDSTTLLDYIVVTPPSVGDSLSFGQDFEKGLNPPVSISVIDYDGLGTWQLDSLASTSGKYSMRVDNLNNPCCGSADEMVLPSFDFTTIPTDSLILMTFKWAYARSDASFSDEMIVLVSTDCGVTFTQKYYRTGSGLVTGPTQTTPFIPDSSQWKEAVVFLDMYQNETNVQIKIVNVSDGGNNLYVDDIYVGDGGEAKPLPSSISAEVTTESNWIEVFPNPAEDFIYLNSLVDISAIEILNITGQVVKKITPGLSRNFQLSTNGLKNGVYFIQTKNSKNEFKINKIIINK